MQSLVWHPLYFSQPQINLNIYHVSTSCSVFGILNLKLKVSWCRTPVHLDDLKVIEVHLGLLSDRLLKINHVIRELILIPWLTSHCFHFQTQYHTLGNPCQESPGDFLLYLAPEPSDLVWSEANQLILCVWLIHTGTIWAMNQNALRTMSSEFRKISWTIISCYYSESEILMRKKK